MSKSTVKVGAYAKRLTAPRVAAKNAPIRITYRDGRTETVTPADETPPGGQAAMKVLLALGAIELAIGIAVWVNGRGGQR